MACFCNIIHMQFSPFGLAPFLTTNWPWRNCYLDSGCKGACLAAELYFNETPLSCSCEALLLCAMFDKSLCKECAQTPAPLKPFRATGHGNCVFGPEILSSANCYFSQHRACITVSFHCPLWPLYLESCNIMRDDNGDFIRGEVEWLKLPKWEFGEKSHYVSRKTLSPLQLYLFLLPLSTHSVTTHNGCKAATSDCGPWTTETILWDWLFLFVPRSPAGSLVDGVWFSARTFQSGVTLKIIDVANVFTTVSAVALYENNRWFI